MENPVTEKMVTAGCPSCQNVIDVTGIEPGEPITCPYCAHEFSITRQFGNFVLERQLGAGGMGAVYLGQDTNLNRVVAVKVLRPELANDQKFMATFLREAEITASLNHPNIVQVYAFGQHEEVYYMVVEYISGGSLDDRITERGRITELEGIEIGIAVARGLECALDQGGLIHRDIKPGNILFNANNTPKVVDFGLSLSYETADHFEGEIWGTPYYVAPEKLERKPEDFRSDLYSLGATLFHAISGRPPYEGEDPNEVAMKHLSGSVVSLKAFVPDISDQTTYAISRSMARQPDDRYSSYAEFIEQLEDAKRRIIDPDFRAHQAEDVAILETASTARIGMWVLIGLVAVVAMLVGLFIWKGSSIFQSKTEVIAYTPGAAAPALENGVVNYAVGKTFVSSDPNSDDAYKEPPDLGRSVFTGSTPVFPKSITINLQKPVSVGRVTLGIPKMGATKTIQIWTSLDGAAYQLEGTHTFLQGVTRRVNYRFAAAPARYVRLVFPDHYDAADGSPNRVGVSHVVIAPQ